LYPPLREFSVKYRLFCSALQEAIKLPFRIESMKIVAAASMAPAYKDLGNGVFSGRPFYHLLAQSR
jgi:hypothetical protein